MATNGTPEQSNGVPQHDQPSGGGFSISGKMLGIAGGGAAALVVVIVVVVLLVTGAFSGGSGASGGGDWLGYVPADAVGVAIADNQAFFGGDVPEDFVEYLEEYGGESEEIYDFVDVDEDDLIIHANALDANFDETLEILRGDFDFDIIREELEDGRDCEDDDYRGFELWECPGQEYPAVALFEKDKYVVLAAQRQDDLEDVLTYKSREPEKLADSDDSEIKRLLNQTDGWIQFAMLGDRCPINRCEGFAVALGESNDSTDMPASYALLFNSERAATAAEDDVEIDDLIEAFFDGLDLELDIGEVKAEGEFVVGSGTAEFVDPDNARSRSANLSSGERDSRERESARGRATQLSMDAANEAATVPAPDPGTWIYLCESSHDYGMRPVQQCACLWNYLISQPRGAAEFPRFSYAWLDGYGPETGIDAVNACIKSVQWQGEREEWPTPTPYYQEVTLPTKEPPTKDR